MYLEMMIQDVLAAVRMALNARERQAMKELLEDAYEAGDKPGQIAAEVCDFLGLTRKDYAWLIEVQLRFYHQ